MTNIPPENLEKISMRSGSNQNEAGRSVKNLDKKKIFKEMLAKHFPDSAERLALEREQIGIYSKAAKKLKEYQKLKPLLKPHEKWLTDEEKFAIEYFHGKGIYKKYQDPKTPSNLFDTRQTFLKKMENEEMRRKFLENSNRLNPIKNN